MSGDLRLEGKNLSSALKLLKKVSEILEKKEITYTLDAGTLLGIYREQRLLPWDNDVDISIKETELDKILSVFWKIRLNRFRIKIKRNRYDDPPLIKDKIRMIKIYCTSFFSPLVKNNVCMDIFIVSKYNDMYYWFEGGQSVVKKSVPSYFFDSLSTIEFNGKKYPIPSKVEDYLKYRYGNWEKPKMEWDYKKDDGSIVGSHIKDSSEN